MIKFGFAGSFRLGLSRINEKYFSKLVRVRRFFNLGIVLVEYWVVFG